MFKNVKKALLFVVLVLVSVLAFACGEDCPECEKCIDINEETCKDYCGECKEANKENCVEYCPENEVCDEEACKDFIPKADDLCRDYLTEEKCQEFFPIVAPTSFSFMPDLIEIGTPYEIEVEDVEPEGDNVYTGFYWYSSDESIATVDENGIVTALRPGTIEITAKSILDTSVEWSIEFVVNDPLDVEYDVLQREEEYLLSLIPTYASKSFTFPATWNANVEMTIVNEMGETVDGFVMPSDLEKDTQCNYTINLKVGSTTRTVSVKIWACLNEETNVVTRLNAAVEAAETILKDYINGELVSSDLVLPTVVYGTTLAWDSNLKSIISSDGEYTRQNDDTPVTLSLVAKCGDNSVSKSYTLTAKGYSQEEKIAYILEEGSLARVAGQTVTTSVVLPSADSKFKAGLTYKSQNPEVMDDSGKLLKEVDAKTEVKFTLTVDYSFVKTYNFTAETEFSVYVEPKNDASKAAEKWLTESGYNKVVYFPYGTQAGNVLDVPTTYELDGKTYQVKWDVSESVVEPKYLASEDETTTTAFELTAEGKPELTVQFLRYTQVPLTATFSNGSKTATVSIALSIGISNDPTAIYTGTWRNSDQKDSSLNERTGSLDTVVNASHFDKTVGYVSSSIGYGYWSGVQVATTYEDKNYEYFNLDYMYWEVVEDEDGNLVKDAKSVYNNAGDMGGNWGWMMKNTTDHEIWIEVGTYAASGYNYVYNEADDVAYVGENGNWFIRRDVKLDSGVKAEGTEGAYTNEPKVYNGYYMFATETGVEAIPSLDDEGNQVKDDDGNLVYTNTPVAKDGFYYIGETNTNIAVKEGSYAEIADGKWIIVYKNTGQAYGKIAIEGLGSRLSWSFDGYALGFIADATGKVLRGSGTGKFEETLTLDDITTVGSDEANEYLVGDTTTKGSRVHYVVIPAGGYAMCWKYQFYSVGSPSAVYPFCQTGAQLEINEFGVHPLNSYKATTATSYLTKAETYIAKGGTSNNETIETNLLNARDLYETELSEITKANVFSAERLEEAEKAYAEMLDTEIAILLLKENEELGEDEDPFVTQLGNMYTRLQALNTNITSYLTKKEEFDAKYEELAKIDLTITLDYKGGYAEGIYSADDFDIVIPLLLNDLYDWMISQNAWEGTTAPTREEFTEPAYFGNNYASNSETLLTKYLFTAKYDKDGNLHEDYHDIIEGTTKFFNSKEYHDKWIDIMDYVDEATRCANMNGQDAWGRNNETYQAAVWSTADLTKNNVIVANKGETLGAYRFAQYIAGSISNTVYKNKIPANKYSDIFDRQYTQENCATIVYHCTDGEIELPAAHKDGYEFGGWYFDEECTKEAEITGAYFKDVTLYAKWNPATESAISKDLGKEVEGVYYKNTGTAAKEVEPGTVNDQVNTVGLGKYGIVVGNKLFIFPKHSLIELGKDATEATTYADKESLRIYGVGVQNSTGIYVTIDEEGNETFVGKDTFGHGALYLNAGTFDVVITNMADCYGREIAGTAYGYHKYVFSYDAEKETYIAKFVGINGELTLKPGEFLWCPMIAERYCTGLTDCDGTSGVKGVLSDGIEVQIIDMANYTYEDVAWYTVKFVNGEDVIKTQYLDEGEAIVKPDDLSKIGYEFLGWATTEDATEAEEIIETPTADTTYYAVWKELTMFENTTVNPEADGSIKTEFKTIAEALSKTLDGGTITVAAGTYTDALVIETPVTILGPNAGVKGYAARKEEAKFEGTIIVNAKGVKIDGLAFTGQTAKVTKTLYKTDRSATVMVLSGDDFAFVNNYVTSGKGIVFEVDTAVNFEMSGNFFNWTTESGAVGGAYWRPIRMDGKVTNLVFSDNKIIQTVEDDSGDGFYDIVYVQTAAGTVNINNNNIVGYSYNWNFNIASALDVTELNFNYNYIDGVVTEGVNSGSTALNVLTIGDTTNANFVGNVANTAGTTFSYGVNDATAYAGTITITDNKFLGDTYKPRIKQAISAEKVIFKGNYIKAGTITALDANKVEFKLDGNYTSETEFDSANYDATKEFEVTKFATGYVNGKDVYIATKYQFNAYYDAEVSLKYDVATNSYIVIANEKDCTLDAGTYDLLLAVHGSCTDTDAAAIVKALKAGDKLVFNVDFATITGYSATSTVEINVTVYPVK